MRKRAYQSRSTFDDPTGTDESFRAGQRFNNLFRQTVSVFNRNPETEARRQRIIDYQLARSRQEAAAMPPRRGNFARRSGPRRNSRAARILARATAASRSRRRKRGYIHKRPRSTKYAKFIRKRRFGRGRRRMGRLGRRSNWLRKYLKLSPPMHLKKQEVWNITTAGDNLQNKCAWLCIPRILQCNDLDLACNRAGRRETAQANLVTGDVTVSGGARTENYIGAGASTYHRNEEKVIVSRAQRWIQFKNQCNKRVDVQYWIIMPRRDITQHWENPTGLGSMFGTNPPWIARMFDAQHNPPLTTNAYLVNDRLQAWDEHNADPFMSAMPKFFKIKKMGRKFLEPGVFFKLHFKMKKMMYLNTVADGLTTDTTDPSSGAIDAYQAKYKHMRKQGPLLLVRCQGSATHDASTATMPLVSPATITMTMSGFNVEVFSEKDWKFFSLGPNIAKPLRAMVTDPLPNFVVANERNFELRQEQNDAMDIA